MTVLCINGELPIDEQVLTCLDCRAEFRLQYVEDASVNRINYCPFCGAAVENVLVIGGGGGKVSKDVTGTVYSINKPHERHEDE